MIENRCFTFLDVELYYWFAVSILPITGNGTFPFVKKKGMLILIEPSDFV